MGSSRARRRRFRRTTDSNHPHPIAPNVLERNFDVAAAQHRVGDGHHLRLDARGLAVPRRDSRPLLATRRRLGHERGHHAHLALLALTIALGRRRPPPGLLHHSDRGSQYASGDYRRALRTHGVVCSMSRSGNCWDNAVAESFFATLKVELAQADTPWLTRAQAQGDVFEYLEGFYNGQRRHSALGYLSPVAFERQWVAGGGMAPPTGLRPSGAGVRKNPSSVEAQEATLARGVAISISPLGLPMGPSVQPSGIIDPAPPVPVPSTKRCPTTP